MKLLRDLTVTASVVAATMTLASPVFAAKSSVTGSIKLATATERSLAVSGPTFGGEVAFETRVDGALSSQSEVYVRVICEQQSKIVYQWSGAPDFSFPLVDQAGQNLEWDGGDAACTATLIYSVERGRKVELKFLDQTAFNVAGTSA